MLHYLSGGAWDPHDVNAVAATCESSIQFWDLRTMKYDIFVYTISSLLSSSSFLYRGWGWHLVIFLHAFL